MDKYGDRARLLIAGNKGSTLLEYKILYLCMALLAKTEYGPDEELKICIRATDLMKKLKLTGGSAYRRIADVVSSLQDRKFRVKHDSIKNLDYINGILSAEYVDGILRINFNKDIEEAVQYTINASPDSYVETLLQMESIYSFSLFELLIAVYDDDAKQTDNGKIICTINILELREMLGIDSRSGNTGKILWADFNRKILQNSIDEINGKSELSIGFDVERAGRGGKISEIKFKEELTNKRNDMSEADYMQLVREEVDRLGLPKRDAIRLFMAADGDYYKLKKIIDKIIKNTPVTKGLSAIILEELQN